MEVAKSFWDSRERERNLARRVVIGDFVDLDCS